VRNKIIIAVSLICLLLIVVLAFNLKKGGVAPGIKTGSGVSVSALTSQAKNALNKGDLAAAQSTFQALVTEFPNSSEVMRWQKKAEELNIKLLFSSTLTPKSKLYEIKPGDTLTKIARQFKTTPELIMKSNNLASDKIIPGRKVKVWTEPFNILVDKSANTLILKSGEEVFKTYVVATGANNSTPVGNFKITEKLVNPTWFKAGAVVSPGSPENVLGSRWMGINVPGYGIHGTTEPQTLGQQVTQGCVRMANAEVEELYAIVPVGTEVAIVD